MIYKIFGIIGIIAFATVSAFMVDADDAADTTEYVEFEYFDDDEFWDEDNIEYITTEDSSDGINLEPEPTTVAPRAVVIRMSCDEINKRILELREDVKSYPDLKSELDSMLSRQRTQCASTISRRPVHNYENVNPVQILDVTEPEPEIVEEVTQEPVAQEPEKTPEELAAEQEAKNAQIMENLSKGLCGDGAKPNRYGCCAGEVFKEVSPMVFGCCPKDGDGQCLEPMK